ncbi:MAG: hypothetical protein JWR87_1925 [Segetibacter sp.]|nr:hypothetical protein [Segetibacter sp.]
MKLSVLVIWLLKLAFITFKKLLARLFLKLPDDTKSETEAPWHLMGGVRNRVIHEYFGTRYEIMQKRNAAEVLFACKDGFYSLAHRLHHAVSFY